MFLLASESLPGTAAEQRLVCYALPSAMAVPFQNAPHTEWNGIVSTYRVLPFPSNNSWMTEFSLGTI